MALIAPKKGQAFVNNAKQAPPAIVFALDGMLEIHGNNKYRRMLDDVRLIAQRVLCI